MWGSILIMCVSSLAKRGGLGQRLNPSAPWSLSPPYVWSAEPLSEMLHRSPALSCLRDREAEQLRVRLKMTLGLHLFQIFLPFNTSSVPLSLLLPSQPLCICALLSALSALPATILSSSALSFSLTLFSVLSSHVLCGLRQVAYPL